jgi:hypothetical protein
MTDDRSIDGKPRGLEGVVDSGTDKNTAEIRAKGVPGVFAVTIIWRL